MLQVTFQGRFLFLGKARTPGDVLGGPELADALASGRTTMTAITALKNRQLAVLQDDGNSPIMSSDMATGFDTRIQRLEKMIEAVCDKLGVEVEKPAAAEAVTSAEPKRRRRRSTTQH